MPRTAENSGALARRAVAALSGMPDTMRLVLLLRVYDEWSSWEIARAAGYNIKIVRSLEERGLQGVEKALGEALPREELRALVSEAFQEMIDAFHPDAESVLRLRAHLLEYVGADP